LQYETVFILSVDGKDNTHLNSEGADAIASMVGIEFNKWIQ